MRILLTLLCLLVPTQAYALTTQLSNLDHFIGKTFYKQTNSTKRLLEAGYGPKMTFAKDYRHTQSFSADVAVGSPIGTFTRVGGATKPATFINESGAIQVDIASNTARFTDGYFSSDGFITQPGLMIEGASTNLIQDSYFADGTATYWRAYATATITSPDTTYDNPYLGGNITKFVSAAQWDGIWVSLAKKVAVTDTVVYTVSALVRGTGSAMTIFSAAAAAFGTPVTLDPDKWILIQTTYTANATANTGIGVIANNNSTTCYIAYIQAEVLPFASSFIPTTAAALTRNAEKLSYLNASNRTAATESCVMRLVPEYANGTADDKYLMDTDTKQRIMRFTASANDIAVLANETDTAGAEVADLINAPYIANTAMTVGYSMKSTGDPNIACYLAGAADGTNDNDDYTAPAWGTSFWIGTVNDGTLPLYGVVQAVAFFSDTKSAADHARITNLLNGGL